MDFTLPEKWHPYNMTTNPRDLIKRLADELDRYQQILMPQHKIHSLINEARAYLDQPEPEATITEPRGCPTPGACSCPTAPYVPPELIRALELAEAALADIGDAERESGDDLAWAESRAAQDLPRIREALARWGRPAAGPEKPTVMEIIALADEIETEGLGQVDLVRRALARWGRPKPLSLKEQSIALLDLIQGNQELWQLEDLDVIRRALEQLPDHE